MGKEFNNFDRHRRTSWQSKWYFLDSTGAYVCTDDPVIPPGSAFNSEGEKPIDFNAAVNKKLNGWEEWQQDEQTPLSKRGQKSHHQQFAWFEPTYHDPNTSGWMKWDKDGEVHVVPGADYYSLLAYTFEQELKLEAPDHDR